MSTTPRKPTTGQVRDAANEVIAALNAGRGAEAEAKIHAFLAMETDAFEIIDAVRQSAENLKRRDLEILLCRKGVAAGYRFSTFSSRLAELLKETNQPALISDFIAVDYATLGVFHFFTGFRFSGVERLAQALAEILKIPRVQLRVEAFENPQYLFPPMMANFAKTDCVSGHNLTATEPDIQMMQAFAVRPVVIRRNIFDVRFGQCINISSKPESPIAGLSSATSMGLSIAIKNCAPLFTSLDRLISNSMFPGSALSNGNGLMSHMSILVA